MAIGIVAFRGAALLGVALLMGTAPALAAQPPSPSVVASSTSDPLSEYDRATNAAFRELFRPEVLLRSIVLPSFSSEYAVGVAKHDGAFHLLVLRAKSSLWHSDNRPGVLITHCDVEIDAPLAARLVEIWRRLLVVLSKAEPRMGLDGDMYQLAVKTAHGELTGSTWSPDDGTAPGALVILVDTMRSYCSTRDIAWSPWALYVSYKLEHRSTALLERLKVNPP